MKNMKLIEIFNVEYPPTLIFSEQKADPNGINFVSSKGTKNGVVGRIKPNSNHTLYNKGSLTVPLKGSVLNAFVQPEDFYIAHQTAVLSPINPMSISEKLFYCLYIRHNAFKYNYGRQADKTLRDLELPAKPFKFITPKKFEQVQKNIIDVVKSIS